MSKKKKENVHITNEWYSFTKKFTEKELKTKQADFSKLLTENYQLQKELKEAVAEKKKNISDNERKLNFLSDMIHDGGERMQEECEKRILFDENKVEYYYDNQLVGEEEITDDDRQLSIQ